MDHQFVIAGQAYFNKCANVHMKFAHQLFRPQMYFPQTKAMLGNTEKTLLKDLESCSPSELMGKGLKINLLQV